MIVKNLIKKLDCDTFEDFSVKIKTWDLYNGFRTWNHDDPEIQSAKVENIRIYDQYLEIIIEAKITR